ncbi:MAG: hypothetical protein Q7J57_00425 [Gemmobacter sp.]|nr:hypothetical protein [Gemmobacter sp.]
MINRAVALFSYAVLVGFVGILVWYVGRIDLAVVVVLTLALAGWDIWLNAGERDR